MPNPFDQFDASAPSNPFDQFDAGAAKAEAPSSGNWLTKEGSGGSMLASADEGVLPALRDYGLAGLDDLTLGAARAHLPTSVGDMIARAHSNLGPMDPIVGAAGYALGPGKVLGPAGAALGGAGAMGTMAEGMLAGGASAAVGQDPSLSNIASGAGQGALVGGAAGLLGKAKIGAKPGSVDPDAAIAATKQAKTDAYDDLKNYVFNPSDVLAAHNSATLTPGLVPSVSPSFSRLVKRQQAQMQPPPPQGNVVPYGTIPPVTGGVDANDIAHYMQSLDEAARTGTKADQLLAGQMTDALQGVLDKATPISGHAPGEAGQALGAANAANKQFAMAQNLKDWQAKAAAGAPLGQAPLTEAENFYQNDPANYKNLVDLYQQGQDHGPGGYGIGHLATHLAGTVGGMIAGFPGEFIGQGLGYLGIKPALSKMMKGQQQNKLQKALQQSYPSLTGQPLTGAQPGVPVGDMIKNLAIGGMY